MARSSRDRAALIQGWRTREELAFRLRNEDFRPWRDSGDVGEMLVEFNSLVSF